MKTWVLKEHDNTWPHDMICVQVDDTTLLFIRADGAWDFEPIDHGKPTEGYWWEFSS